MPPTLTVESYLAALDPVSAAGINALRQVVTGCHDDLVEQIKWNAPSFSHLGEDRVTLGVDRSRGFRVVLHRGAKPRDATGFSFLDNSGLATWPAPDRAVIALGDQQGIEANAEALGVLLARWIKATAEDIKTPAAHVRSSRPP